MLRKNAFIIAIIFLYILFLCKYYLFGMVDNTKDLAEMVYDEKLKYYQEEYQKMEQILEVKDYDYDVIYSKIVLRDIYEFYDEFTIGKGSKDGVSLQDLVVNQDGVVGIVKEVNNYSSTVLMLTSPKIELSVRIGDAYGILTSQDKKIVVKNITLDEKIEVGDSVYTSGLTSIPGGFLIGEVKEVRTDSLELEYVLDVAATSNLQQFWYVAVIKGVQS